MPSLSLRSLVAALAAPRALVAALLALTTTTLAGCPEDEVVAKNLFLEISSEAPAEGRLQSLRVLFAKDAVRYPASVTAEGFNQALGERDPTSTPVLVSVTYDGATFGDGSAVNVLVQGRIGERVATRFEGVVDLGAEAIVKVRLLALPSGCDDDGDGFLDCGVSGCCAAGSVFADCGAADPNVSPWGVELECEPCADRVDQDCSGADAPCVDADRDLIADCAETCGQGDPTSGPGLPEVCDSKDNDCDNNTDEGLTFTYRGQVLEIGEACGLGACGGGVVECDGAGGMRCSTESRRGALEDCATPADDDCDGVANEGCVLGDFDGDGAVAPADCNDFDAGVFPGRPGERCCPTSAQGNAAAEAACDKNCDGDVAFCEGGDGDGDGVTVAEGDCDDGDASVAPGKPERCGDGVDQDCAGGDQSCTGVVDGDSDGWGSAVDCDDDDGDVQPGQPEVCNGKDDDCDNLVDEGDPSGGAACGTSDVGECALGVEHCKNSGGAVGAVTCAGLIEPETSDVCDGRDEDCDGATDEDFDYDGQPIGATCDGVGACGVGRVECAPGRTDRATCSTNPDGSASGASTEVCDALDNDCDGELNEGVDDVAASDCLALGVCQTNRNAIVATCNDDGTWACDYAAVPGYEAGEETSCDALDNDCDGQVNEDFAFVEPGGDTRAFGQGCDGEDSDQCQNGLVACAANGRGVVCAETGGPLAELCDGADNDCDGETDEDFRDTSDNTTRLSGALRPEDNGRFLGDVCGAGACGEGTVVCGTTTTLKCSTDPRTAASPDAPTDTCDGVDNDCDGVVDEAYVQGGSVKVQNALFSGDNGKVKGAACGSGACAGGAVVCTSLTTLGCSTDANGQTTSGGQTVPKTDTCNDVDDDCDGITDDDFVATTGANRKPLAGALFASDNNKMKGASCGTGECIKDGAAARPGRVQCNAAGTALVCSTDQFQTTDVCDDLDNDCDGTSDDPFLTASGTTLQGAKLAADNGKVKGVGCGTGVCAAGKVVCAANKTSLVCSTDGKAGAETCDTNDNDCDGTKDEGFAYQGAAVGASCDGVGGCGIGSVVCLTATTAGCSTNPGGPASGVTTETCDGVDNDCNAVVDDGFTYQGKTLGTSCTGEGACGAGTVVCNKSAAGATCSTMPDAPGVSVDDEVCDEEDNNCDGETDEGFDVGADCGPIGECGAGTTVCTDDGEDTICSSVLEDAVPEVCDGLDNDCDGDSDDGLPNHDGDDFGDACDDDDDDDGVDDDDDDCPLGALGWDSSPVSDYDGDGCQDSALEDADDDNDGVSDSADKCDPDDIDRDGDDTDESAIGWGATVLNGSAPGTDYDGDGCRDSTSEDTDDDNDGVSDSADACDPDLDDPGTDTARASERNWTSTSAPGGVLGTDYDLDGCKDTDGTDEPATPDDTDDEDDDDDADGIGDASDACDPDAGDTRGAEKSEHDWASTELDPGNSALPGSDYDEDGCQDGDDEDPDDDNDGMSDDDDACDPDDVDDDGANVRLSERNWTSTATVGTAPVVPGTDYDTDGCKDTDGDDEGVAEEDADDDGDSKPDASDACDPGTVVSGNGMLSERNWTSDLGTGNPGSDYDDDGCKDTDGDDEGVADEDTDDDADGEPDTTDACDPQSGTTEPEKAWTSDATTDYDDDGCQDADADSNPEDLDDDNDGRPDTSDACDPQSGTVGAERGAPLGTFVSYSGGADNEAADYDRDGCKDDDNEDGDDDNDGRADASDLCDPDALAAPDGYRASERGAPFGTFDSTVTAQDHDADGCMDEDGNDANTDDEDEDDDNDDVLDDGAPGTVDPCATGETSGCDDNCQYVANKSQTDTDANGVGDACQDTDSDGILDNGGPSFCDNPIVQPCKDNCPTTANATQDDHDNDGQGDACDDCTAADDLDGDTICYFGSNGSRSPCVGGDVTECDDNCPEEPNANQSDVDSADFVGMGGDDGVGDACDPCLDGLKEPHEVCIDCLDNDCDGLTDKADSPCTYRRVIAIETSTSGIVAGHSVSLTFDHAYLRTAGYAREATGGDIRIYYKPASSKVWTEIDRVLDPDSSWNNASTTIWFKAQADIAANSYVTDYYFYANTTGTTDKTDERNVFHFADFFDRTSSATVGPTGSAWTETQTTEGLLSIRNNTQLGFDMEDADHPNNEAMRPVAYRTFDAITSGNWRLRTKWAWSYTSDSDFALLVQLGNSAQAFNATPTVGSTYPASAVGPAVTWARGQFGAGGSTPRLGVTTEGGSTTSEIVSNYGGSSVVDIDFSMSGAGSFTVDPDGSGATGATSGGSFIDPDSDTDSLNAIRLVSHLQDKDLFPLRAFDYVYLQRRVASGSEPVAYFGAQEPVAAACELDPTSKAIARWYFDDDRDDPQGTSTLQMSDLAPLAQGTRFNLARTGAAVQPFISDKGEQHGLEWTSPNTTGQAVNSYTTSSKFALAGGLNGSTGATLEAVVDLSQSGTETFLIDFQRLTSEHQLGLSIVTSGTSYTVNLYLSNAIVGTWVAAIPSGRRVEIAVVLDTTASAGSRVKLYRDGFLSPISNSATEPEANATIVLDFSGSLRVGNNLAQTASPRGFIFYAAVYDSALNSGEVAQNWYVLRALDDRR